MRRLHFIAGCLGLMIWCLSSKAQDLVWGKKFGGTLDDYGKSVAVDASGNVYFTGYFEGTADFDPGPGTFNLTSSGPNDIFFTKLDASGNLIWVKQFGGTWINDYGHSIEIDVAGNIFVAGFFEGTADFDPGPNVFNLTGGDPDVFILKLNAAGDFIWAKQFGAMGTATAVFERLSIDIDNAGNVFATGDFIYSVIKLDASGNLIWSKNFDTGLQDLFGQHVAVDAAGNVLVTGYFKGSHDFDPGPGTVGFTAFGGSDIFISKLDASGNLIWAKQLGGNGTDQGNSITVDVTGNVYAIGYFAGTADFDPGPGVSILATSGNSETFIVKLDPSGNLIWANLVSNPNNHNNGGFSVVVDAYQNVYTTGNFYSATDFKSVGRTGSTRLISAGLYDAYMAKYDASGILIWAKQLGGPSSDYGECITIDTAGYVYATGYFSDTASFGPGTGIFNVGSAGGTEAFVLKLTGSSYYTVQGNVFGDVNANCNGDTSDISMPGILLKAEPGLFYGMSDFSGNYTIYLLDTGSYTVSIATDDTFWQPACSTSYNIDLITIPDTASGIDFALRASSYCPRLTVEVGTPRLRRCFDNSYTFRYANTGTLPTPNAYMEVDFGDYLQPQSSTLPWSSVVGNVYTFQLGNININQSGSFSVTALLNCDAQLGSTQCVTAHIYPDSVCAAPSTGWDKSETKVTGACDNDSLVCFTIKNRSSAPGGNMQGTAPWRLYVNDTLVTQGDYQLAGGDSLIQCYPANGKTYRLEADQRLGHPGNSNPKAIVEACGTNANGSADFGFVNTVPQDDEDLFVETFCMTVIGSFDPNDKQVFPTGITSNKYIKPNAELEYLIRFQNTGNDTAFKVVIRDTIQTDVIDIATLKSGASSHDYTFNIYGHGIAEWTFDNILLPDSFVNEPASNGFVKFKAKLLPDVAPGTLVTNSADIYFDFNAPVKTNEAWNTVFDTVLRAPVVISGTIVTESNAPVPGVKVMLQGSRTDSVTTATDGKYSFELEAGGSYTITPTKNSESVANRGVSSLDILLMRKHLLDVGALPSPYKIIAASEANAQSDTTITTQDILYVRSLILGNSSTYPGSRLWQFVSSDYVFPDASHPFPFVKSRTYENLFFPQLNQNFIGIKLGDVNESWEE